MAISPYDLSTARRNAPSQSKPSTPAPAVAHTPTVTQANPCHVAISADGSGAATIFISPETLRRYKLRAQGVPLDQYLYANVLRAALESHVY